MTSPGEFPFQAGAARQRSNGPPPETVAPAGELFRRLTDMTRAHEVLPFPREDDDGKPVGAYWLQVLTQSEIDDASIDAEKHLRRRAKERATALGETPEQAAEKPNPEMWREIFESARFVELIWRAARRAEEPRLPLFVCPDDIRKHLSPSEITTIVNSYDQLQHRFGPLFRLLTEEEVNQWVDLLQRGGEDAIGPFGLLSPGQLAQLIVSMAARWPSSRTDRFLDGSPSDVGMTGTVPTSSEPAFRPDTE